MRHHLVSMIRINEILYIRKPTVRLVVARTACRHGWKRQFPACQSPPYRPTRKCCPQVTNARNTGGLTRSDGSSRPFRSSEGPTSQRPRIEVRKIIEERGFRTASVTGQPYTLGCQYTNLHTLISEAEVDINKEDLPAEEPSEGHPLNRPERP